ncbi:MAG: hypothetical protein ACOCZ6_05785 [Nanoarchaeota archaeon]
MDFGAILTIALFAGAGALLLIMLLTGIYYLFRRRKKLHEMSPSNTSFSIEQTREVDKEYNKK